MQLCKCEFAICVILAPPPFPSFDLCSCFGCTAYVTSTLLCLHFFFSMFALRNPYYVHVAYAIVVLRKRIQVKFGALLAVHLQSMFILVGRYHRSLMYVRFYFVVILNAFSGNVRASSRRISTSLFCCADRVTYIFFLRPCSRPSRIKSASGVALQRRRQRRGAASTTLLCTRNCVWRTHTLRPI